MNNVSSSESESLINSNDTKHSIVTRIQCVTWHVLCFDSVRRIESSFLHHNNKQYFFRRAFESVSVTPTSVQPITTWEQKTNKNIKQNYFSLYRLISFGHMKLRMRRKYSKTDFFIIVAEKLCSNKHTNIIIVFCLNTFFFFFHKYSRC